VKRIKVGVALSGGVDSASTAIKLKKHYDVTAFFMQLAQPDIAIQIERVTEIADKIGIPLTVIDLSQQFEDQVLKYFCNTYYAGRTPNPCIICNRKIKFGLFLDAILSKNMEKAATGHYARIIENDGIYHLAKGADKRKDQSYFLARLDQHQLSKVIFPLGEMTKEETYSFMEHHGFHSFRGNESQDVCFLQHTTVAEFLRSNSAADNTPGTIINEDGVILGEHPGIFNFTIGQRRGLGISDTSPYYVTALDAATNTVLVGKNELLLKDHITLKNLYWATGKPPEMAKQYTVKIRYTHKGSSASITHIDTNSCLLEFAEPQRAITPGQFGVIYDNEIVIGCGEIV